MVGRILKIWSLVKILSTRRNRYWQMFYNGFATAATDQPVEALAVDLLHGVIARGAGLPDIKNWHNIGMVKAG